MTRARSSRTPTCFIGTRDRWLASRMLQRLENGRTRINRDLGAIVPTRWERYNGGYSRPPRGDRRPRIAQRRFVAMSGNPLLERFQMESELVARHARREDI